ncbi:hypothetical protein DFH09DRAFT_1292018 [Mycena vulgaris]|nr:hypothetical protein DFH09DRAFT_1292018 [Mycena vulgaris]
MAIVRVHRSRMHRPASIISEVPPMRCVNAAGDAFASSFKAINPARHPWHHPGPPSRPAHWPDSPEVVSQWVKEQLGVQRDTGSELAGYSGSNEAFDFSLVARTSAFKHNKSGAAGPGAWLVISKWRTLLSYFLVSYHHTHHIQLRSPPLCLHTDCTPPVEIVTQIWSTNSTGANGLQPLAHVSIVIVASMTTDTAILVATGITSSLATFLRKQRAHEISARGGGGGGCPRVRLHVETLGRAIFGGIVLALVSVCLYAGSDDRRAQRRTLARTSEPAGSLNERGGPPWEFIHDPGIARLFMNIQSTEDSSGGCHREGYTLHLHGSLSHLHLNNETPERYFSMLQGLLFTCILYLQGQQTPFTRTLNLHDRSIHERCQPSIMRWTVLHDR